MTRTTLPRGRARVWTAALALALMPLGLADAKSLYLIADINASPTPIRTYDIQPGPAWLVYQAQQTIPSRAGGAVGLAIDTENKKLFTTYEGSNVIQLVDATNFANLGTTTAPGASNLAGIVVDQGKKKIYAVDRDTNHLYVYSWSSATNTLTLDGGTYIALAGVQRAHGLALDEGRNRLYVGDVATTTIRYYTTAGFGIEGSVTPTTTTQTTMGVAVDTVRNAIYLGNAYQPYGSLGQLVRIDMTTRAETVYTLPGATPNGYSGDNILGIAVDEDTGNVYATTGNQGSGGTDTLIVFSPSLAVLKNDFGDIGSPTGLAIPRANISYNPLNFSKTGPAKVASGANATYTICYDNLANSTGATNVAITDTLPANTAFVAATGAPAVSGSTVTWTIGPVAAKAPQACVDLTMKINAAAGTTVFNTATITGTFNGAVVPTTQGTSTDVIGAFKPLSFNMIDSVDPVRTGTNLTYTTCVGPAANTSTVTNVQVSNPIPAGTSFVSASAGGALSGSTVNWNLGSLAPGAADSCVTLTLAVSAAPGAQITNTATISSDNTAAQNASHATDVISNYKPLPITYDDNVDTIATGAPLTLHVCYDNTVNTLPVTGVKITAPLPDGTSYVSSTGPATFDGTFVVWNVGNVAAGAAQACYDLSVVVTDPAGSAVTGAVVLTSNEVQASSAARHSSAIVRAPVVTVDGEGGGSVGLVELLLGSGALLALRRRRAAAAIPALAALTLGLATTDPAQAAGPGWYAGAGVGTSSANASADDLQSGLVGRGWPAAVTTVTLDKHTTGGKAFVGYRFTPMLSVEGSYVDLGKVTSVSTTETVYTDRFVADVAALHPISLRGWTLSGVVTLPVGPVELFAKAGLLQWRAEAQARLAVAGTPSASVSASGSGATFGIGVGYEIPNTRLGVRGEWEKFMTNRNDPSLLSVSLVYRF